MRCPLNTHSGSQEKARGHVAPGWEPRIPPCLCKDREPLGLVRETANGWPVQPGRGTERRTPSGQRWAPRSDQGGGAGSPKEEGSGGQARRPQGWGRGEGSEGARACARAPPAGRPGQRSSGCRRQTARRQRGERGPRDGAPGERPGAGRGALRSGGARTATGGPRAFGRG